MCADAFHIFTAQLMKTLITMFSFAAVKLLYLLILKIQGGEFDYENTYWNLPVTL